MAPSLGNSDVFGSQNSINGEDSDKAAASETVLNVIIVGGGLGGLAAAIALRQQGHKVEVIIMTATVPLLEVSTSRRLLPSDIRAITTCERSWCRDTHSPKCQQCSQKAWDQCRGQRSESH